MVSKRSSLRALVSGFGVALVVSLAFSALGVASASAATQHWYSCKYVGEGKGGYNEPTCTKGGKEAGSHAYSWVKLTSPIGATTEGTTSFTLAWSFFGIPMKVTCTSLKSSEGSESTIENPAGGGAGTAQIPLVLSGCTVVEPSQKAQHCSVYEGGTIKMPGLYGVATEFEGKPALKINGEGVQWLVFVIEGCESSMYNRAYWFEGSFTGIVNTAASSLEFTKASSGLIFAGLPATLEGTSKVTLATGEAWKLAP